jgi:hypothetical protein
MLTVNNLSVQFGKLLFDEVNTTTHTVFMALSEPMALENLLFLK